MRASRLATSLLPFAITSLLALSTAASGCGGSTEDDSTEATGLGQAGAAGASGAAGGSGLAGSPPAGGAAGAGGTSGQAGSSGEAGAGQAGSGQAGSGQASGIGEACSSSGSGFGMGTCGTGQTCIPAGQFGFDGGYCTQACSSSKKCPSDAKCLQVAQSMAFCFVDCESNSDCRDGYECEPQAKVCFPKDPGGGSSSGKGVPPATNNGEACTSPAVDAPGEGSLFEADQQLSSGAFASEVHLAAHPQSKRVVASWIDLGGGNSSGIGVSISDDDGKTWKEQPVLPLDSKVNQNSDQSDPVVAADPAGNFYIAWLGFDRTGPQSTSNMTMYVARAMAGGAFKDLFISSPKDEWTDGAFLDKPWIAASPVDGTLYMTWTRQSGNGPIDIRLTRSTDQGKTWSSPITISDSAKRPQFQRNLAQVAVGDDGTPVVVWVELLSEQFGSKSNRIYLQRINADGTKNGDNVQVSKSVDSPAFMDPAVATAGGKVYVSFTSGTPDGAWDVRVATSLDGGASFSQSQKLNDDATCATHFLQQITVDGDGNVHAIFIDNRYLKGNVFHVQSPPASDGAPLAFGAATFVNAQSFDFTTDRDGAGWLGDYLGFSAQGKTLYAVWSDPRDGASQIHFARGTAP